MYTRLWATHESISGVQINNASVYGEGKMCHTYIYTYKHILSILLNIYTNVAFVITQAVEISYGKKIAHDGVTLDPEDVTLPPVVS